jgi:hypothetical protein
MLKSSIFTLVLAAAAPALAQQADVPAPGESPSGGPSVGIYGAPLMGQEPAQQQSDQADCWRKADTANTELDAVRDAYAACLSTRGYEIP